MIVPIPDVGMPSLTVPAVSDLPAMPAVPASPMPVPGTSVKTRVTSTPGPTQLHLPPAEMDLSVISDDKSESE